MKKLLNKYDKDFVLFLKHGARYTTSKLFVGGLSFIAIPIYTRLMEPKDYGILALFDTAIGILSILYGLQMYGAIGRYYLESKSDFPDFLGTSLLTLFALLIIQGLIFFIFKNSIMNFFGLASSLFFFVITISITQFGLAIYGGLLEVKRCSNEYMIISFLRALVFFIISILLTYYMKENRYLGYIYAKLFVTIGVFLYSFYKLIPMAKIRFKIDHLKYALNYNIPAIPGALSTFMLAFFDRVIINKLTNTENTGLYSLACNIAMVLTIFFSGLFSAWFPTFVEFMEQKKYDQIRKLTSRFANIIFFLGLLIALFSKEIVTIMAPSKYHASLKLIPIIIIGYLFLYIANVYSYFVSYRKEKIIIISINVIIVVGLNIFLNYLMIPKFGYSFAAATTAFSYFILMFLNYFTVRYLLKENVIHLTMFILKFVAAFISFLFIIVITKYIKVQYISVFIKFIIVTILGYLIFIREVFLHKKLLSI
jgi:O-antigen/teichoic acid export membrane protein